MNDDELESLGEAYRKSDLTEAIIEASKSFDHKAFRDHVRQNPTALRLDQTGVLLEFTKEKGSEVAKFKGKKKRIRTNGRR